MKKRCLVWLLLVVLLLSSCGDLGKDSGNGTPEPESPSVESEDTSDSSDDGDGEDGEDSESDFEEPSGSQTPDNNNPGSSYTYTNLSKTMWAKTNLNVRSEPSKIGEVIGYLAPNEEVKVTGQCNETGWYRIVMALIYNSTSRLRMAYTTRLAVFLQPVFSRILAR